MGLISGFRFHVPCSMFHVIVTGSGKRRYATAPLLLRQGFGLRPTKSEYKVRRYVVAPLRRCATAPFRRCTPIPLNFFFGRKKI